MAKAKSPQSVKTHFQYYTWVYILIIAAGWFVSDLAFTMTEYRPPDNRKVEFQMVQAGFMDTNGLDSYLGPILLSEGQAYDETLEAVYFYGIAYSGDSSQDMYGAQKYSVMLGAQQGDVWIVPRVQFEQLSQMAALMPLDDYAAQGIINTDGLDLTGCYLPESTGETDEDGNPVPASGPERLFGLPVDGLKLLEDVGYHTEDCYAVIMHYSANPDTSATVLNAFMREAVHPLKEIQE